MKEAPCQSKEWYNVKGLRIFQNPVDFDEIIMIGYLFDNKYLIGLLSMVDVEGVFAVGEELLVGALVEGVEGEVVDCLLSGIHLLITYLAGYF